MPSLVATCDHARSLKTYTSVTDTLVEVRLEVPLSDRGMRLDRFVQRHIARLSRERVQHIIKESMRDGEGKATKPARIVKAGETFVWQREVTPDAGEVPELEVLYEDDLFLAVNKPAGVVVHPTAKVFRQTVTAWLREHRPEATIAHRLDRDTSGVLLCGKGRAGALLKEQFRRSRVRKVYLAIVRGEPVWETCTFAQAMMLDDRSALKVKMRIDPAGLPSLTHARVLERHGDHALVECRPATGRQHQIRVHLHHAGHTIVGDKLYGVPDDVFREAADLGITANVLAATGARRHLLHAAELHWLGANGEPHVAHAPLPSDMELARAAKACDTLRDERSNDTESSAP